MDLTSKHWLARVRITIQIQGPHEFSVSCGVQLSLAGGKEEVPRTGSTHFIVVGETPLPTHLTLVRSCEHQLQLYYILSSFFGLLQIFKVSVTPYFPHLYHACGFIWIPVQLVPWKLGHHLPRIWTDGPAPECPPRSSSWCGNSIDSWTGCSCRGKKHMRP